jgi:hypothetical protein
VVAGICIFILYCLYFLLIYATSRGMAYYVVYSPTLPQVEGVAKAGEWHDMDGMDEQGHRQRIRFLTVESSPYTITVNELEDLSTSERRLIFGAGVVIETHPWAVVAWFAREIIPFAIGCLALFPCWRVVRQWYVARRRGIEHQRGFEVL